MKVIANCTSLRYGYVKGDILELKRKGALGDIYHAENLSNPDLPMIGGGENVNLALIYSSEFDLIKANSPLYEKVIDKEFRFFGINILTIYKHVEIVV